MTFFSKVMAVAAAVLPAFGLWAAPAPKYVAVAPLCAETQNWNQAGSLNAFVHLGQGYYCGCDPLAWGQVLVYHALKHGYPAKGWVPKRTAGKVLLYEGNEGSPFVAETWYTLPGAYNWEAIRDQGKDIWKSGNDLSRLMRDLATLGGATFQKSGTKTSHGTVNPDTGSNALLDYFGYDRSLWAYEVNWVPNPANPTGPQVIQPTWRGMAEALLRGSLQAESPMVVGVNMRGGGHAIVCDGYGFDAQGKVFFHLHMGWGAGAQFWVPLEWFDGEMNLDGYLFKMCYPNTAPKGLGCVVTGRVAEPFAGGVRGAAEVSVVLTYGGERREVRTDAAGCYAFANVPTETSVTVTVERDGVIQKKSGATGRFLDSRLRQKAQDAYEAEHPEEKGTYVVYSEQGNLVLDFAVAPLPPPVFYAAPAAVGAGDGRTWGSAAALTQAVLDARKPGEEVRLLQGDYPVAGTLRVPAGVTLMGGFAADGRRDVLGCRTSVKTGRAKGPVEGSWVTPSYGAELAEGAVLDGVWLEPSVELGSGYAIGGTVRNTVFTPSPSGWPKKVLESAVAETCWIRFAEAIVESATVRHCSFAGALQEPADSVLEGNLVTADADDLYKVTGEPGACTCGRCPALGLDGRPLRNAHGAVAPRTEARGYSMRLTAQ